VQGSKLLKGYVMLSIARQAAERLHERGLRARIVQRSERVMGPPYQECSYGLVVDYSNWNELAQAKSLV